MVLTRREREVAELVAVGLTNRAIAERLFLSERTVEGHIDHAFAKLGLSSRTQLAMWVGANARSQPTMAAAASSFPAQLTSFIGRQKDIATVQLMLADHRLVTLVGPGGSGKTRLALELAKSFASGGTHTWLVDVSPVSDAALVAQVVAGAVGASTPGSPIDALVEYLATASGILLLDNCEHVVSAVAELVATIAAQCPGVKVLVTSREPIHLAGEAIWRVEPLAIPSEHAALNDVISVESVRLFADRARLAAPGFQVDEQNGTSVAEVCRRLDGLPLALELAAARVAVLSPSQILGRLEDRFSFLVSESRSSAARHHTLKTALEWSFGMLPPSERRLFARLSVFAGSFNLDAVEAVAGAEPFNAAHLIQLLGLLIDKSLVTATGELRGELRYRLLDSMRSFGREKLMAEADAAAIIERHARLYASISIEAGKRLGGPDATDWIALVAEEMDNLRAALEWAIDHDLQLAFQMCASLSGYWDLRGWIYEGRHWLNRVLAADAGTPTAARGSALAAAGLLAYRQSDYGEAFKRFSELLEVADLIGDPALSARALAGLGDVHIMRTEPSDALRCYEQSLEIYRSENDISSVARGLSRLGNAYDNLREYDTEERLYQESLALFRQLNDRVGIADQLFSIGMGRFISGKWESALPFLSESLAVRRELGDVLGVAFSQMGLGYAELRLGHSVAACDPLRESLTGCDEAGDARGVAATLDFIAGLLLAAGKPHQTIRLAACAAELRKGHEIPQMPWFDPVLEGWLKDARSRLSPSEAEREEVVGAAMPRRAGIALALEQLASIKASQPELLPASVTPRERQVVALVADGLTNREIAKRLSISARTADSHVQHVMDKLGYRSRAQLAAWHASSVPGTPATAGPVSGATSNGRFVTTILMLDVVGSTAKLAVIGDQKWRDLLDRHYRSARAELSRFGGVEIDTAGDGMLATFDGPATAIRCARAIQRADRSIGLASRAGVHSGEVERSGRAIRGIAVHVVARLTELSQSDEVLVSSTARDLAAGSGVLFEDRGTRQLKGVPEARHVYAVSN